MGSVQLALDRSMLPKAGLLRENAPTAARACPSDVALGRGAAGLTGVLPFGYHAAMRLVVLAVFLLSGCAAVHEPGAAHDHAVAPAFTLERLVNGPSWTGVSPSSPAWSPDGRWLAFRWRGEGSRRELWLVERDGTGLRQLTNAESRGSAGSFAWLPDGAGLLVLRAGGLWRLGLDGAERRVADLPRGVGGFAVAPDGRHASFSKDGDLWLVGLDSGAVRQLTDVGEPPLSDLRIGRYARREVEVGSYVWGGPTYAWAPDGRSVALHLVDRRQLRQVPFPNYLGEETDPNFVRRSYPGDPNEHRAVAIVAIDSGAIDRLDLPAPTATRVVDFSWSNDGRLLVDRESDTAVDRWLHVYDPSTRQLRELWHDRRESRVYTTAASAWHADGRHVIVLSDRGDRYGLYALAIDAPQPRLLTDPRFDVLAGPTVADDGAIFYTANDPSPYERHAAVTTLVGNASRRLTRLRGDSRAFPSPDGKHVALLHSNDTTPTELYLVAAGAPGTERRITDSQSPEFAQQPWANVRYVTFPSLHDDATLHARILEPRDLDRTRRHPVIFGPIYSNTVRNRWGGFYGMFQQVLVAHGYIVVQVDVRGSTGYGREFREQFLMDFAGRDLDDLESAVAHMESLPFVDPDRIGIWGSSYGGTLTAYALLKKPGLFDAGVACAAAVDPHFFGSDDVAIVRRPASHPAAFERGAAQYAANLEDPLLLIHGMQDQVVPFKTAVDLAEALMRAGKDFDFAFAPAGTHGWTRPSHYARYLLGKLMAHFERHLGSGEQDG